MQQDACVAGRTAVTGLTIDPIAMPSGPQRWWSGVSPRRGPGCCAARRAAVKGPASCPFGRPSLTQARRHPPRSLARRVLPDCGTGALPVRSPVQRSRLRLHRDAGQPGQAGFAGGHTTAARSRARGSRAWFYSRVRERGPLDELTKASPPATVAKPVSVAPNAQASSASAGSSVMLQKTTDSLRKMGDKRPGKQASLDARSSHCCVQRYRMNPSRSLCAI